MHFTSVDLPAPLSPSSARISPKRRLRPAPRSASRWPTRFQTPRHSIAVVPISRVVAVALLKFEYLHPLIGEGLDPVVGDPSSVLPARAELVVDDEGVDLERHVLLERVIGGLFHPRRLHLDQPKAMA